MRILGFYITRRPPEEIEISDVSLVTLWETHNEVCFTTKEAAVDAIGAYGGALYPIRALKAGENYYRAPARTSRLYVEK